MTPGVSVMLFMTDDSMTSLIANKLELGADASVSAESRSGPALPQRVGTSYVCGV